MRTVALLSAICALSSAAVAEEHESVIKARITFGSGKSEEVIVSPKEQRLTFLSGRGRSGGSESGVTVRLDLERNVVELVEYEGSASSTPEGKEYTARSQYIWFFPVNILEKEEIDLHRGSRVTITRTK